MDTDLIEIARIQGPYGLDGRMWVSQYGDPQCFSGYTHLIISPQGNPKRILSCERQRKRWAVRLEGIKQAAQVELIKGEGLYVKREWLPELKQDEHYWVDLIGLKVLYRDAHILGEIVDVFSNGSNDVYVVDREKQLYIPATRDVVTEISLERGVIVIERDLIADLLG